MSDGLAIVIAVAAIVAAVNSFLLIRKVNNIQEWVHLIGNRTKPPR